MATRVILLRTVMSFVMSFVFLLGGCKIEFSGCMSWNYTKTKSKNPNDEVWECRLNDLLPKTMIRAMKDNMRKVPVPILLKDRYGMPIPEVAVIMVLSNDLELNYTTDSSGIFIIELSSVLVKENPVIKIRKNGYKAKDFFYEVGAKTVRFDESEDFDVVNLYALNFLERNGIRIYYNKEDSAKAMNLIKILEEIKHKAEQCLGVTRLEPASVLLTESKSISTIGDFKLDVVPVNINDPLEIYWIYTHELIESNLISRKTKSSYQEKNFRWINDGIAEYVSLKILEQTDRGLKIRMLNNRLKDIKNADREKFNLFEWGTSKTGSVEGYAYSLAFWLLLEENYGDSVIQKFVNKFIDTDELNSKNIANILFQMTGAKNESIFILTKEQAQEIILKNR